MANRGTNTYHISYYRSSWPLNVTLYCRRQSNTFYSSLHHFILKMWNGFDGVCFCGRFVHLCARLVYMYILLENKTKIKTDVDLLVYDELIFAYVCLCLCCAVQCIHEWYALFSVDEGAKRFICHFNSVCVFKMYHTRVRKHIVQTQTQNM